MYFLIKKCVQQWYNNSVFKKNIDIDLLFLSELNKRSHYYHIKKTDDYL